MGSNMLFVSLKTLPSYIFIVLLEIMNNEFMQACSYERLDEVNEKQKQFVTENGTKRIVLKKVPIGVSTGSAVRISP